MMAASTHRRHGHVAGVRRRPFYRADVDTPSGVIEELDEDEATTGPVGAAVDPVDAVDAAAEPAAEDVREVSGPAEAGAELVAAEETAAEETAAEETAAERRRRADHAGRRSRSGYHRRRGGQRRASPRRSR
jgi:hypothetical protein